MTLLSGMKTSEIQARFTQFWRILYQQKHKLGLRRIQKVLARSRRSEPLSSKHVLTVMEIEE